MHVRVAPVLSSKNSAKSRLLPVGRFRLTRPDARAMVAARVKSPDTATPIWSFSVSSKHKHANVVLLEQRKNDRLISRKYGFLRMV